LVDACAGLATGPLTRWFDNNTFIRTPVVRGELAFDRASFAAEDSEVGLLPGPYTFSRLAGTDLDRNTLMGMLTQDVLRPAAAELVARGARILHLQEPWLVAHGIEVDDWSYLADALRLVRDGLDAQMVVHTYFGNAAPWLDRLQMLPVDAIGVDLTETDVAALERPWPVGILLGCLDGRSSVLEEVDATVAVARHVVEVARPPVLALSSSCDLELLPRTLADRKVQVLGEAALRLRQELGC
jgi:methionine synthase II (cobalamin-independent)